jgi:FkbM family methyltransferase
MPSQGFLYRRIAAVAPCAFPHVGSGVLTLRNKYDIASVRDVFMSTHYWRAFEHVTSPPELIVDLGAHCGHFSLLCHLALLEKFGVDQADYLLVEANPRLLPQIRRVIDEAGFFDQVKIVQGLVGKKEGSASFQSDPRNLLSSRAVPATGNGTTPSLPYIDLDAIIPPGPTVDLLKIDIEGSEYDLLEYYPHLFQAAKLVLIEVHGPSEDQQRFEQNLAALGLVPFSPAIIKESERLLLYGSRPAIEKPS